MPFKPGQSGNPAGRRKEDASVKELARAYTKPAIEALVKALKAKSERTRVAAAEALLDRGWGRPAQEVMSSVMGPDGKPIDPRQTFVLQIER